MYTYTTCSHLTDTYRKNLNLCINLSSPWVTIPLLLQMYCTFILLSIKTMSDFKVLSNYTETHFYLYVFLNERKQLNSLTICVTIMNVYGCCRECYQWAPRPHPPKITLIYSGQNFSPFFLLGANHEQWRPGIEDILCLLVTILPHLSALRTSLAW